jgi:hypothetical protein
MLLRQSMIRALWYLDYRGLSRALQHSGTRPDREEEEEEETLHPLRSERPPLGVAVAPPPDRDPVAVAQKRPSRSQQIWFNGMAPKPSQP